MTILKNRKEKRAFLDESLNNKTMSLRKGGVELRTLPRGFGMQSCLSIGEVDVYFHTGLGEWQRNANPLELPRDVEFLKKYHEMVLKYYPERAKGDELNLPDVGPSHIKAFLEGRDFDPGKWAKEDLAHVVHTRQRVGVPPATSYDKYADLAAVALKYIKKEDFTFLDRGYGQAWEEYELQIIEGRLKKFKYHTSFEGGRYVGFTIDW